MDSSWILVRLYPGRVPGPIIKQVFNASHFRQAITTSVDSRLIVKVDMSPISEIFGIESEKFITEVECNCGPL